jgi:hypothetical protein
MTRGGAGRDTTGEDGAVQPPAVLEITQSKIVQLHRRPVPRVGFLFRSVRSVRACVRACVWVCVAPSSLAPASTQALSALRAAG